MKKNIDENSNTEIVSESKLLLHIAEYNNLTGRCTYFINIQAALVIGLIMWMGGIVSIWVNNPTYIYTWAGIFGFQIIEVILLGYVNDQYNIVRYLESSLRPQIKKLVKEEDFWQYESFNKQLRGNGIMPWEIAEAFMSFFLISLTIIIRIKIGLSRIEDLIGCVLNMLLFFIIIKQSYDLISVRKNFEKPI